MQAVLRTILCWLVLTTGLAHAEPRIALVLGNSGYSSVSPLDNPAHDARLIGDTLTGLGFDVTLLIDASQLEMKRGISQFGRALREAGPDATGLFYYAGHGVQSFGNNYLLPVDIALNDAADLDLMAIEAQTVLRQMYSARNKTNIVILDACRNNPFSEIPAFNDNGLAEMQAPTGTFLSYATAPGSVALDGLDGNSPFTQALARLLPTPGLPIEQMFKQVRVEVIGASGGQQTPWDSSSLTNDFTFAQATPQSAADLEAEQVWNSVKASRDPVQIMLFLRGYGDSKYAGEARGLLASVMERELAGDQKAQPKAQPAGPSPEEQKMFETAQAAPSEAAWDAYLQAYPTGTFAEFAQQELAALRAQTGGDPVGPGAGAMDKPLPEAPKEEIATPGIVTFETPLVSEQPEVNGKSIAELITGSPIFPPIEGLPESYWKGQHCSNCHEWTRERICTQANTYLSLNMQRSLTKAHPFGGALKRNLKAWAAGGCL
ncbi:caspase domain-containing protein [Seohaeicola nanhaiensis]|uniref:Caspase domain-containing protein n=1 Tax=Seohaeicola nanhaiensis TaxID=1387282 RepID=A0ABV9KG80_9RHOB